MGSLEVYMKIKIVSDSSSNVFSMKEIEYTSVPLKVLAGEKEYVDDGMQDISQMVEHLRTFKGKTSTSCPNVAEWMDAFGDADIIYGVSITSNLSGSYNAAMQAKQIYEEKHPDKKVYIFDSLSAGSELKLILEKILECVKAGLGFEETVQEVTAYMTHTHTLFMLESLQNLARNGRVSHAVATAAGILGIRIIGKASDVGTIEPIHKCRGEKKAISTMYNSMKECGFDGGKVRIAHCLNEEAAEALAGKIHADYPDAEIEIISNTVLCSYYAEKGGLIVGYEGAKK